MSRGRYAMVFPTNHRRGWDSRTGAMSLRPRSTSASRHRGMTTGKPYQTSLDPPPGPPGDAEGKFLPLAASARRDSRICATVNTTRCLRYCLARRGERQ